VFRSSTILANNILPINRALAAMEALVIFKLLSGIDIALFKYPQMLLQKSSTILLTLEKSLLNAVLAEIDPDIRRVIESQLKEINFIQRVVTEHTNVAFYKISPFYYNQTRNESLNYPTETSFAQVHFEVEGNKYFAKFYAVNGNIFSIEFNKNISSIINKEPSKILKLSYYEQ